MSTVSSSRKSDLPPSAGLADGGETILPNAAPESLLMQSLVPSFAIDLAQRGRADEALAVLEHYLPVLDQWEDKAWLEHQVATVLSASEMGHLLDVNKVLDRMRRRSTEEGLAAGLTQTDLLEARMNRAVGNAAEAIRLFRQACSRQEGAELFSSRAWTLAQLAGSLAESGQHTQALRTLAVARNVHRMESPVPPAVDSLGVEVALVHAHSGDRVGALRAAFQLAEQCAADGRVSRELGALHLAARLGEATSVVARASSLGERASSRLLRLQVDHVIALAEADGDALDVVCERLRRTGMMRWAAESAAQSVRAYCATGRCRRARTVEYDHRDLLVPGAGLVPPWAALGARQTADHPRVLTAREQEIAVHAASGLTNRQIARQLMVSVRTVENHLQRAYGKLGITSRAHIAEAL